MSTRTTDLFLLEDLEDGERTGDLPGRDLDALEAIAGWIKGYVVRPHSDLGRTGSVCPFVPGSLDRQVLWLAPEHVADRTSAEIVELMTDYKSRFLRTQPTDGDDARYKVIVVVFTDLSPARAGAVFADVQQELALRAYAEDGILFGPFYEGNEGTAIYNSSFRPFQSPVPFLFVRNTVVSDWKFFLDDEEWFGLWAHRFGEAGAGALAEELRRLPWRGNEASS